jgi:hypothetical protein
MRPLSTSTLNLSGSFMLQYLKRLTSPKVLLLALSLIRRVHSGAGGFVGLVMITFVVVFGTLTIHFLGQVPFTEDSLPLKDIFLIWETF